MSFVPWSNLLVYFSVLGISNKNKPCTNTKCFLVEGESDGKTLTQHLTSDTRKSKKSLLLFCIWIWFLVFLFCHSLGEAPKVQLKLCGQVWVTKDDQDAEQVYSIWRPVCSFKHTTLLSCDSVSCSPLCSSELTSCSLTHPENMIEQIHTFREWNRRLNFSVL